MAGESGPLLTPGQTLIFLGDHTSPDHPGYVALLDEVISRFHPELGLRLITAGSPGQSAAGLRSPELLQLLTSARPDWVVAGIGLADAMREPAARRLAEEFNRRQRIESETGLDATFGPEILPRPVDTAPAPALLHIDTFAEDLGMAVKELQDAGVRTCLLTTILLGNSNEHPVNLVVSEYNRAIREQSRAAGALLVDIEAACRDVIDRAANYNQTVALTGPRGELNAQGQALLARCILAAVGVLPSGGRRGR
jgi:hypothetical protein